MRLFIAQISSCYEEEVPVCSASNVVRDNQAVLQMKLF